MALFLGILDPPAEEITGSASTYNVQAKADYSMGAGRVALMKNGGPQAAVHRFQTTNYPPFARLGVLYGRAGSTSVFSTCTDFKALGLRPR